MSPIRFHLLLLLLIAASTPALGQRLTLSRIDTSGFPVIKARIYPLDASGKPIAGVDAGDFIVEENGERREVIAMECPPLRPPEAISSVLTIDVSGSMAHAGRGGTAPNIELARAAALAWIDALPSGESECAITSFDDRGLIINDFTRDRDRLRDVIAMLGPNGGTNYNAGLLEPPAGGLAIAGNGSLKRVVIFLTDGMGSGSEQKIVEEAERIDATIFCVTLGMRAPKVLKNIAIRTGGDCFENVTSADEARAVYRAILYQALGGEPCSIEWRSESGCSVDRDVTIKLPSHSLQASASYKAPRASVAMLEMTPPSLAFGSVAPGETKEITVTLTAKGRPITIQKIEPVGRVAPFSMENISTPFTLPPGTPRTITIRYAPTDSNYAFARWKIESDGCSKNGLMVTGGARGKGSTIHLLKPNGGERFKPGEIATIGWEGVLPNDTVRLEYSMDGGESWRMIDANATGLSYQWKVPPTPSERCLARVGQPAEGSKEMPALTLKGHTDYILASNFSRDGRRIVTASWDGTAKIWDATNGTLLRTLVISTAERGRYAERVYYAEFSPDGSRVLTASENSKVQIWDAASGRMIRTLDGLLYHKPRPDPGELDGEVTPDPVFSANGSRLILRTENTPTLWDANSGAKIREIRGHSGWVNTAIFNPAGTTIASAGNDSIVRIWNAANGAELRKLTGHGGRVTDVTYSHDGRYIASVSSDNNVRIWEAESGTLLHTIPIQRSDNYLRALFSPDGTSILIWAGVSLFPQIHDIATGEEIRRLQEPGETGRSSIGFAAYSPDGSRIAVREAFVDVWDAETGAKINQFPWDMQMSHVAFSPDGSRVAASMAKELKVWEITGRAAQQDQSDDLWAIVDARPASIDVDFGRRPLNAASDSVVTTFIRNDGESPLVVDSIGISGSHRHEFTLVSGIPPFEVAPRDAAPVEFRFVPMRAEERTATLEIYTGGRKLTQRIRGEGVKPSLQIETKSVDFGTVDVGDSRDTVVQAVLKNTGAMPVEILDASLIGPDTTQFHLMRGDERFTIPPGGTRAMTVRFNPARNGRTSSRVAFMHDGAGSPASLDLYGHGSGDDLAPELDVAYSDPTTFRTIAIPNAVVPAKESIVTGIYDVAGLMAGYVPIDHVMILAGGALPLPDDWGGVKGSMYGAYSLGLKAGLPVMEKLDVALGYQWGQSIYDQDLTPDSLESRITVNVPYAAISYGDDDSRVSATFGYAFKRHRTIEVGEYDKNALLLGIGADYRFAKRWKVAVEALTMETMGYAPVAATVRFFGERYAIDAGLGYLGISTGGETPSVPVAPVVSWVVVW